MPSQLNIGHQIDDSRKKQMSTFHLTAHTDSNGLLKLEVPVGLADIDVVVEVTVTARRKLSREEWLKFIDETAGKINDSSFFGTD